MSILWAGGEDIDFPNGGALTIATTAGDFRAGYARCTITQGSTGVISKSTIFPGGAITSAWMSARVFSQGSSFATTNMRFIGFGLSGTSKGLFVGTNATAGKLALFKYDGTTYTELASESGTTYTANVSLHRLDMQVVGPLVTAVVKVYWDGALIIAFSGDVTVSGLSNYDSVFITRNNNSTGLNMEYSEIIVADEDVRSFPGVVTLALTGAGTTDSWTASTFSNINGTTINDASPMSVNTNAQDSQYNVTDLPTGNFTIKAVKIAARCAQSATPAVTKVQLGYNSGGSIAFHNAAQTTTAAYATYESMDAVNPVTGVAFTPSEINALQLDARSAT